MRRVIANEYPLLCMFATRLDCQKRGRAAELPELDRLAKKAWRDRTWRNVARRAGYHLPLLYLGYRVARKTYVTLRRLRLVPEWRRSG